MQFTVKEYVNESGKSPFSKWFDGLDALAASKISSAIYRLAEGNTSNVKSLGEGIFEYKVDFGPGYRIYFAKTALTVLLLFVGGTKKRQNEAIKKAKEYWRDYKQGSKYGFK